MSFAKIFQTIYDSSISEDWKLRVVFQDMLILADKHGIVDMTPQAMARRTNLPLEMILEAIPKLESPDPLSRTKDRDGKRLERLDHTRTWGWRIVNYEKYRESATAEMLRMAEAERKKAYRAKFGKRHPLNNPLKSTDTEAEGEAEQSRTKAGLSRTCPGQSKRLSPWELQKAIENKEEMRKSLKAKHHDGLRWDSEPHKIQYQQLGREISKFRDTFSKESNDRLSITDQGSAPSLPSSNGV